MAMWEYRKNHYSVHFKWINWVCQFQLKLPLQSKHWGQDGSVVKLLVTKLGDLSFILGIPLMPTRCSLIYTQAHTHMHVQTHEHMHKHFPKLSGLALTSNMVFEIPFLHFSFSPDLLCCFALDICHF